MPAIDALGLFYDFRELTPIGRRGDEMIRRLDRPAGLGRPARPGGRAVAASGRSPPAGRGARAGRDAARGHLPDEPQAGPGAWRRCERRAPPNSRNELRNQRLLLEARALSDIGRHDVALEVDRQYRGPRGDPPALRHPVGGQALARGGRADRAALRRSLARLAAAQRHRARRHLACRPSATRLADDKLGLDRFREQVSPPRWRRGRIAAPSRS